MTAADSPDRGARRRVDLHNAASVDAERRSDGGAFYRTLMGGLSDDDQAWVRQVVAHQEQLEAEAQAGGPPVPHPVW